MIQHVLVHQLLLFEQCLHTLKCLPWSQPRALLAQQSPFDRLKRALELERSKGFKNSMGKVQLFDTFLVSALPYTASHRRQADDHRASYTASPANPRQSSSGLPRCSLPCLVLLTN